MPFDVINPIIVTFGICIGVHVFVGIMECLQYKNEVNRKEYMYSIAKNIFLKSNKLDMGIQSPYFH